MTDIRSYSTGERARYSGVSTRTLQYYDREKYGRQTVEDNEARVLAMGKEKMSAVQAEFDRIYRQTVADMPKGPDSPEVQAGIGGWLELMENFTHYTDEMALGLGRMYSEDERFAEFYRKYRPDMRRRS